MYAAVQSLITRARFGLEEYVIEGTFRTFSLILLRKHVIVLHLARLTVSCFVAMSHFLRSFRVLGLCCGVCIVLGCSVQAAFSPQQMDHFTEWLRAFKAEAHTRGITQKTLALLDDVTPYAESLERDQRQPEFRRSMGEYLRRAVHPLRIRAGQTLLRKHAGLLRRVSARYGVQPHVLVAFWGLETNYGQNFGNFSTLRTLVTLAWDPRRSKLFRAQLFDLLALLDKGKIHPQKMKGSWAGAMGNFQFMPSVFNQYAVDYDKNGVIDLWKSLPDSFASAAHYLSHMGWRGDERWGREVRLPKRFDFELASLSVRKTLREWSRLGVRRADGSSLPYVSSPLEASLLLPEGASGPAFLVYDNFRIIMRWNRSTSYALAVGHLSDRLIKRLPFSFAHLPAVRPLSREHVREAQILLSHLGYDPGDVDGVLGSKTRAALRQFQKAEQRVPDAYLDTEELTALRRTSTRSH